MSTTIDAEAVICEVMVEASPEVIFELLTDPAKIVQWMGVTADISAAAGGRYHVDINPQSRMRGDVVEVVPNERVVFTFGWEGRPIEPGSTTVQIDLLPKGSSTLVRLAHAGLPEEAREEHAKGWTHYLARLATVSAGGDPGPDIH